MRTYPLAKRRASGGGGASFTNLTNWSRPSFTQARTVPFITKSDLDTALANMQPGDLIQYTGTGVLTISSASANNYTIQGKNPASTVVIDFGTKATTRTTAWGAPTSSNYVKFDFSGTGGGRALWITNCSNLNIYGGEFTSNASGILVNGTTHDCWIVDQVIHDVGGTGISLFPTGTTSIHDCTVRCEVGPNWAMNPPLDPHGDKGTGLHCCNAWDAGTASSFYNNRIAIHGHDSLQPGATSFSQVWPEGGGGSVIQFGQPNTSGTCGGNELFALGVNNLMIPNGTNPGSTQSQTGGNVINGWGSHPLTGTVFGWLEGNNITGCLLHTDGGAWSSTPITVNHGRGTSTNQSTAGSNVAARYPVITNVTYNDCT